MTDYLSPSPYGWHSWDITPERKLHLIHRQMHKRNGDTGSVIDTARRARDYQASLAGIVSLIRETSQRYNRGSVTRVAMDNLLLEISERFPAASLAIAEDEG